jgi:hypothetical protein
MKHRYLILIMGALIGSVAGILGGAVANWISFNSFSMTELDLPSSYIPTLALCAAFPGLLGGLISGLFSLIFGRTKTALLIALLLGAVLGFCFGFVGGIWAFLGLLFAS